MKCWLRLIACISFSLFVRDSGGSRGGARPPPLFWVNKEEMTEEGKAGSASETNFLPLPP